MTEKDDILYCPFYEVNISVGSEMIDKLGVFPIFVLKSLSNEENTIEKITKATNLNPSTVMDTVEELIKNGLLEREKDNCICHTELGNTYLRIYKFLESSKVISSRFAVNAFTGMLETVKNQNFETLANPKEGIPKLPCKVSKLLIKNHNYSNIKEFMRDKIDLSQIHFNENDYQYINFDLKPKQLFYVPYSITYESIISEVENEHGIKLCIPIEKVCCNVSHVELEINGKIINQIKDISLFNKDLLSDKAMKLLKILNKTEELSAQKPEFYDCYIGKKLNYQPCTDSGVGGNMETIKLTKRMQNRRKVYRQEGFIFTPDIEQLKMYRMISFDSLKQLE